MILTTKQSFSFIAGIGSGAFDGFFDNNEGKTMYITNHMQKRLRQRGRNQEDISLVLRFGTRIAPNTTIMRRKDGVVAAEKLKSELPETEYKQRLQRLDHLYGYRLIHDQNIVITGYHRRKKLARISRRSRKRP